MSKIIRAIQKIFGSTAAGDEIAQIGSLRAGSISYTTDLVVMQALSEYLGGLNSIVNATKFIPALEDINAMYFMLTTQIAYIFQEGVAEYDATTEYHQNSIVKDPGTFDLYYSVTDTNTGNALSNPTYWLPFTMDHAILTNVLADQHHNESHTLASHSSKTHAELTAVSADQHHAQSHTLASHSSKTHAELTTVTPDQHHNESHTLASHSSKTHAELTSILADQHHAQQHALNGAQHTGDLNYIQLDSLVAVSGVGDATHISRSNHAHTGADGSPSIAPAVRDIGYVDKTYNATLSGTGWNTVGTLTYFYLHRSEYGTFNMWTWWRAYQSSFFDFRISIGGQTSNVVSPTGPTTGTTFFSIDVSSLSNNTWYPVLLQAKTNESGDSVDMLPYLGYCTI